MKKIIFLLLTVLFLSACGTSPEVKVDLHEMVDNIGQSVDIGKSEEVDMTEQKNSAIFGLSADNIVQGYAYYTLEPERADKVVVVEAKDEKTLEEVEKSFDELVNANVSAWKNVESENKKVENYLLKTKDKYVIFAISSKVDRIEEIFDDYCENKGV